MLNHLEENEVVINSAGLDGLNGISWNEALKRVSGSRIQQTIHGQKFAGIWTAKSHVSLLPGETVRISVSYIYTVGLSTQI